jgi:hypothetical protein
MIIAFQAFAIPNVSTSFSLDSTGNTLQLIVKCVRVRPGNSYNLRNMIENSSVHFFHRKLMFKLREMDFDSLVDKSLEICNYVPQNVDACKSTVLDNFGLIYK